MIRITSLVAMALAALTLVLVSPIQGEQAKKIAMNDVCPPFSDLPGVDGKKHSLSEFKKDIVVVVVTCTTCPVAIAYEGRIVAFADKNKDKVDFLAIDVSDGLAKLAERAKESGFTFPFLFDESQEFARSLGATVTPHFFVLDKNRKLVYRGAMDDNNKASSVTKNYLDDAVAAVRSGESPAPAETNARGCNVRYQKTKTN